MITAPTLRLSAIEWTLDRPAQINIDLVNKRTVGAPLYGKWYAKVTLAAYETEALFCPVRSFLFRCNGVANSFQLPATIEPQNGNSGVTASAATAGATSLTLTGTSTALLDGQMVTVNDQLLQLTEDQSGSTITFEPPLRAAVSAGASVETANPYALVRMTGADIGWQIDPPEFFSASFNVEEVVSA